MKLQGCVNSLRIFAVCVLLLAFLPIPTLAQELLKPQYRGGGELKYFEYGASGMVGYEDIRRIRLLTSSETVKVTQSEQFPHLRLLFAPSSDKACRVRIIVHRASPQTEKSWGVTGLLEAGPSKFLLSAKRPGRDTSVIQLVNEGAGYRDEIECDSLLRCTYHWFDVGAELTIRGSVTILGAEIESDTSYSITFKMTSKGWVLMCGRGKVKPAGAPAIAVGQQDNVETWLPLLRHKDQLAREAATEALGWIGAEGDDRGAAIKGLLTALGDPAWEVRRNAAESLGRLKESTPVDALKKLLNDKEGEGWVSAVAQEALTRIGPK